MPQLSGRTLFGGALAWLAIQVRVRLFKCGNKMGNFVAIEPVPYATIVSQDTKKEPIYKFIVLDDRYVCTSEVPQRQFAGRRAT